MGCDTIILSVIITCFNYEKYVELAIQSIVSQGRPSVEIIVVDDGSTDDSWSRITKYQSSVTAFRKGNGGPLQSAMFGFSKSRGKFVYFLDADDLVFPGSIDQILNILHQRISKIQFQLTPIDHRGNVIGPDFPNFEKGLSSSELISKITRHGFYSTPPTSGNVYRRDVYENLGTMHYERAIDGVPFLLAPYMGDVISIHQPLAAYRLHRNNISGFAVFDGNKIQGYLDRFSGRLMHLDQLLKHKRLRLEGFKPRSDYFYICELSSMRKVARGERLSIKEIKQYVISLKREYIGKKRFYRLLFLLLIVVLPDKQRRHIVEFRFSPLKNMQLRASLKRLLVR